MNLMKTLLIMSISIINAETQDSPVIKWHQRKNVRIAAGVLSVIAVASVFHSVYFKRDIKKNNDINDHVDGMSKKSENITESDTTDEDEMFDQTYINHHLDEDKMYYLNKNIVHYFNTNFTNEQTTEIITKSVKLIIITDNLEEALTFAPQKTKSEDIQDTSEQSNAKPLFVCKKSNTETEDENILGDVYESAEQKEETFEGMFKICKTYQPDITKEKASEVAIQASVLFFFDQHFIYQMLLPKETKIYFADKDLWECVQNDQTSKEYLKYVCNILKLEACLAERK